MEFDPAEIPQARRYGYLIGAIAPRPIAVVGTQDREGRANLAPYSCFNGISSEPFLALFCPANRADGGEKDSLANAKPVDEGGTGCFSISVATMEIVRAVVACSEPLAPGESEFALSGLTPRACRRIAAPFVAESPVHMELETVEVRRFAPGVPDGGNLVIGRIVHMRIDDGLLDREGRFDPAAFDAVWRMGGLAYCTTRGRFDLPRGRAALAADEPPHAPS